MNALLRMSIGWLLIAAIPAIGQDATDDYSFLDGFDWVTGPTTVGIADRAELQVPHDFGFLHPEDTAALMELMENPGSENEYFFAPRDLRWFALFSYEDTGHINDDEKIDADALLDSIRQGTEMANRERRNRGWAELRVVGWQYPPFYEPDTQRLAWAILGESEGVQNVNYNTRLLGRTGVMSAVLVADVEIIDSAVGEFKSALEGFDYRADQRYSEYRQGDKLATYGLAALVAGGAAAAVAQTGIAKSLFKFVWVAVVAVFAGIANFVKRIFGKRAS